jgi:hypothetical protein
MRRAVLATVACLLFGSARARAGTLVISHQVLDYGEDGKSALVERLLHFMPKGGMLTEYLVLRVDTTGELRVSPRRQHDPSAGPAPDPRRFCEDELKKLDAALKLHGFAAVRTRKDRCAPRDRGELVEVNRKRIAQTSMIPLSEHNLGPTPSGLTVHPSDGGLEVRKGERVRCTFVPREEPDLPESLDVYASPDARLVIGIGSRTYGQGRVLGVCGADDDPPRTFR